MIETVSSCCGANIRVTNAKYPHVIVCGKCRNFCDAASPSQNPNPQLRGPCDERDVALKSMECAASDLDKAMDYLRNHKHFEPACRTRLAEAESLLREFVALLELGAMASPEAAVSKHWNKCLAFLSAGTKQEPGACP